MRIKICGLRRVSDIEVAVEEGATAIGFVFARSPRQILPGDAPLLFDAVPAGVLKVAVFREPDLAVLAAVLAAGVDVVQADSTWDASGLDRPFLPAFSDGPDLAARVATVRGECLVDGPAGGGSGVQPDSDRVRAIAAEHHIYLAGGLTPENVAARIEYIRPWGVDVSSGVELSRGIKDPGRIRAFIRAALQAG